MISVVTLWETIAQWTKTGTSGYQSQEEFNRDLDSVQRTGLITTLSPLYETNQAVADLLGPFIESVTANTVKPTDYFRFLAATVDGQPAYRINANEVAMTETSPIRSPDASGQSYYYFIGDVINFLTPATLIGTMVYMRYPEPASIALTPTSTPDSDYLTPTSVADLEWPESAFNMIAYMMLQRLGVEMREQLAIEMANLGIQQEIVKI